MPQDTAVLTEAEALAALEWYRAAGIDLAVGEVPIDRLAALKPRTSGHGVVPAAASAPSAPPSAPARDGDPSETRALAAAANSLEQLRAAMEAYEGCGLRRRATQLCFADGNPEAEVMLVGEGPGEHEDLQGKPFVGPAGQLLDRMLAAIGLDRTTVYIANMVPWRPPGNRDPSEEELALCAPFLHRQVELVRPRLLVTLGNVPTKALFETKLGITRMRGQWRDLTIGGHAVRTLATLHPAFLLRTPGVKEQAWRDMLALRRAIEEKQPPS